MRTHQIILLLLPLLWVAVSVWTISGRQLAQWPYQAFRDWVWLALTLFLVWQFAVYVGGVDPDPVYVSLAKNLTSDRIVSLQDISPKIETVRDIYRLDTDNDGIDDWVTFIKHESRAYSAAVYKQDPCRAPEIVTFPLTARDNDYIAEILNSTFTNPWPGPYMSDLDQAVPYPVLVILSRDGQTLNIFRWVDESGPKCTAALPGERRYDNIGSFRGNGGVSIQGSQVLVKDRGDYDRSQFAIQRVYEPQNGTYFGPDGALLLPVAAKVTFQFDSPSDLAATFYPEKAVVAFYESLFQKTGSSETDNGTVTWQAQQYLSTEKLTPANQKSGQPYSLQTSTFGLNAPREAIAQARILSVSYFANVEAEQDFLPSDVTIIAVPVDSAGNVIGPESTITWRVIADPNTAAKPYGCEWKLDEIVALQ